MFRGKRLRRLFAGLLAAVLSLTLLAGCGGSGGTSESTSGSGSVSGKTDVKVGIVIENTFGSQNFNDVIVTGAEKAAAEFGFEVVKVENIKPVQSVDTFRMMIDSGVNYFILPAGSYADAALQVGAEHSDVCFLSIDYDIENAPDNFCCVSYREQEAAFLTGAFCQLMSKTGKTAFIGGAEGGIMARFEFGFKAGAWYIDKNAVTTAAYVGYNDVNKGKETALMMYNQGVDFIAAAAAASNLGVFQASKEKGGDYWVCGAADGQFHMMPDRIMVSQVKRLDNVAYNMLKDFVNGKFQKAGHVVMGLREGGVDMLYTTKNDELLKKIPEDVKTKIESLRKDIINGKITVPATKDEFEAYKK